MPDQSIGQLLDTLGVTADIDPDDMPTDALVILKIVRPSGTVGIIIGTSETMDWITQAGLLSAADAITSYDPTQDEP